MKSNWYETHVRYEKVTETGTVKKVDEAFLVDALSFAEAEARTIEEMIPFMSGEFEVTTAKRVKLSEIFLDNTCTKEMGFYRAKIVFVTLDEKSGEEKKSNASVLVQANDFESAVAYLTKSMEGTLTDWYIYSMTETKYMNIFGAKQ